MAHGLNSVLKKGVAPVQCKQEGKTGIGSRRIFSPHFKLQVLDSYRNDSDCKGNQRATARKYGIHRRQIQKWLQVENTLRNSVSAKSKITEEKCVDQVTLNRDRQRDGDSYSASTAGEGEHRVPPSYVAVPLDFTTHGRCQASPNVASSVPLYPDPCAPMDLSLKRPALSAQGDDCNAPVPCYAPLSPLRLPSSPHPDVWDLSTKKRKYDEVCSPAGSAHSLTSPKPVKLFKPYLDDPFGDEAPVATTVKAEPTQPCCSAVYDCCYNNNNNNNVCDVKAEYSYTLHELQPKSYYCPYYPTSEYDVCGGYSMYDDYGQSPVPAKQRQSYSLDFKLSAIDCYYQDSVCKGNQRAVASKYNVHRRQVQKWLKQSEELKMRNETAKQIHAVS